MTTSQRLVEAELDAQIAGTQECREYIEPIEEFPNLGDWRTLFFCAVCLVGVIGYCVLTTGV